MLKRAVKSLRYTCAGLADRVAPVALPSRGEPVRVAFVFHVEHVADPGVFSPFHQFLRWLRTETGCAPTVCITTPHCPLTRAEMAAHHVDEAEYARRIADLAEVADVGYHGHFYQRHPSQQAAQERCRKLLGPEAMTQEARMMWRNSLSPMSLDAFHRPPVAQQIKAEMDWLRAHGFDPITYVAGWWVLNAQIVMLLEAQGIRVDCSVRRDHTDTFGGHYLAGEAIVARGEPSILMPSDEVVEIQSAFYPVDHPRRTKRLLAPTLSHKPNSPLFLALPSHEGETIKCARALRDNVRLLLRHADTVCWTPIREQLAQARAALAGPRRGGRLSS